MEGFDTEIVIQWLKEHVCEQLILPLKGASFLVAVTFIAKCVGVVLNQRAHNKTQRMLAQPSEREEEAIRELQAYKEAIAAKALRVTQLRERKESVDRLLEAERANPDRGGQLRMHGIYLMKMRAEEELKQLTFTDPESLVAAPPDATQPRCLG